MYYKSNNVMKSVQQISQYAEVVEASVILGVSVEELSKIPVITGDTLDSDELCMIYAQYLSYVQGCENMQQQERSLQDWLIDTQFEGLTRMEGVAERARLIGLGFKL